MFRGLLRYCTGFPRKAARDPDAAIRRLLALRQRLQEHDADRVLMNDFVPSDITAAGADGRSTAPCRQAQARPHLIAVMLLTSSGLDLTRCCLILAAQPAARRRPRLPPPPC